jgi:hypothetical protein
MLAFLMPGQGGAQGQPLLDCNQQLIPVLRGWMQSAAHSPSAQQAAALLLADQVLASRLYDCSEFPDDVPYSRPEDGGPEKDAYDALEHSLKSLGIGTYSYRGGEYYSGTLLLKIASLAPSGPVNELYRVAVIDEPCTWEKIPPDDSGPNWHDRVISVGESILRDYPHDEWTPSVHLMLAEAYALASQSLPSPFYRQSGTPTEADLLKKALQHYRAWYAGSENEHDRKLVWREIWDLQAGLAPRLTLQQCADGYY